MKNIPLLYLLLIAVMLLIVVGIISLGLGVYQFKQGNSFSVLWRIICQDSSVLSGEKYVLIQLRAARIVMGILIGSMLAFSGTLLQGLFKNPLASPDLIGLNSGATLAASIAIVLGSFFKHLLPDFINQSLVSFFAFVGALVAIILVYRISTSRGTTNIVIMLLAGAAFTAIGFAITGFLIYLSKDQQLRDLTFWNLGSLAAATWSKNGVLLIVLLLSYFFLAGKGKTLNALLLGEKDAKHIGINVEDIKRKIILFSALMIGSCVAFSGTIGFVGLIIPYILRFLFKSDYRYILPLSAVLGSILLISADAFSRTLLPPTEIPIGIITALLGGPVFIAILLNFKKTLR